MPSAVAASTAALGIRVGGSLGVGAGRARRRGAGSLGRAVDGVTLLDVGLVLDGKYEVCGVLGEGASGVVYDVRRLGDARSGGDERVALKVIHRHLMGNSQLRGRFVREVAILQRLKGKHLCPILESGELTDPRTSDGMLYMAIPKVDGPSLEKLVASSGPLPIERAIDIVLQICSALVDAHGQGIIHRDLKPANVLLRGGEHVVVVDFGMAKIVTGAGGTGTTDLTTHNMVFGTPEYMAPEQARGDELDARCDVYAVGIILYELLSGKVPFHGASPLNVLTAHMTADLPPLARDVGPALHAVIHSALLKSPDERYANASDLARALEHALRAPDDVDAVSPRLPRSHTVPLPSIPPQAGRASAPSVPRGPAVDVRSGLAASWILVWVLAIATGIAVGVWLSLHT
ncbi:serine/threonine protein kinase [Pendulispora rubella]|uniref:Serine/threonine protein kinase n=1 Tax=Pendulispora rubella TaxID=2741070 RepID=A0ABZ2L689_9BACT